MWYFVIADCERMTSNMVGEGDSKKFIQKPFSMRIELYNGDSQFSEEEFGHAQMFVMIASVALGGIATKIYSMMEGKNDNECAD